MDYQLSFSVVSETDTCKMHARPRSHLLGESLSVMDESFKRYPYDFKSSFSYSYLNIRIV